MVRMKKIELGPFAWADPLVSLSQATAGAFTSEDYAGNIGTRILERFKVTLDYERRQMWLEPGARYPRRDVLARSGMQLARAADTVRVMAVLPGSAGAAAGLREGDVVTALDGRPAAALEPADVTAVLDEGAEGSTHTLDVLRDGKKKRLKIKLKEML
jgi:predicted metalloprotease with PDZ domain